MSETIEVSIPVDAGAAAALDDMATRARIGRLVSRMLGPSSVGALAEAIADLKAEAQRRGLTDQIVDEELATYNAERRTVPPPR